MIHDPEDEVTVISSEGIAKGVLEGNTIRIVGAAPGTESDVPEVTSGRKTAGFSRQERRGAPADTEGTTNGE